MFGAIWIPAPRSRIYGKSHGVSLVLSFFFNRCRKIPYLWRRLENDDSVSPNRQIYRCRKASNAFKMKQMLTSFSTPFYMSSTSDSDFIPALGQTVSARPIMETTTTTTIYIYIYISMSISSAIHTQQPPHSEAVWLAGSPFHRRLPFNPYP